MAERPQDYEGAVIRNLDDLLVHMRSTGGPAPRVQAGYWPTFCLTWETDQTTNFQIEVFEDRYEIYRFFDRRTDIWHEPHRPGAALSDQLISELPTTA